MRDTPENRKLLAQLLKQAMMAALGGRKLTNTPETRKLLADAVREEVEHWAEIEQAERPIIDRVEFNEATLTWTYRVR